MKNLIYYLRPYFGRMGLGLIIKFVGTIMDLFLPWILAYIIDHVIPNRDISLILIYGGIMIACSIIAWVFNVVPNRMASRVAMETTRSMRHDLFSKIMHLSATKSDEYGTPSLISRLSTDTYNTHHMVGMIQRLGVRAPILLIGGIAVTLSLEPVLTLVLIALMPFITIAVYSISRKGIPLYTAVQKQVDILVRTVRSDIAGIRVIKALSKMDYERERFASVNQNVTDAEKRAARTMTTTNPLMNLLLNVGLTLVLVAGAWRVNSGLTAPGTIIAFLSYFTIILTAMLNITRIFVVVSKGIASAERIQTIMQTEDDRPLLVHDQEAPATASHIVFDNVSFSYPHTSVGLRDISFSLEKGQTLGIIGATGSGKTTLIKLLLRLYDVDAGEIRIDGIPIRSIPDDVLYTQFGVVFQNDFILADTIKENISFGRDLGDHEVETAAAMAQAADFIAQRPGALADKLAIKGANISGGQKQRLLIARALASRPPILILDDAASALDYRTDARVRSEIQRNLKDTTTIIIAQRVSSIMHADHIMVMEGGRVIGSGTHAHLVESCDIYREISSSQMGGYHEKRA